MSPQEASNVPVEQQSIGVPSAVTTVEEDPEIKEWLTPGSIITREMAHFAEVRLVAERLGNNGYVVFLILEDDPEEVLDAAFDAERRAMAMIPQIPFDLRVRKPHPHWAPDDLLATCVTHYARPQP